MNSIETDEKNRLIADAIVMAYLPYARASRNVDNSELERCCWETQNMLDKHGFNLRSSLQVSQQGWHSPIIPQESSNHHPSYNELANVKEAPPVEHQDNEKRELEPQSLIIGSGELDEDGFFADDEFD